MSSSKPKTPAATKAGACFEDESAITHADIQKEVKVVLEANQSFLNSEQVDIFNSLAFANAQQLVALLLNLVKEASVVPVPPKPKLTSHMTHVTRHTSYMTHVTRRTSHVTRHKSQVTRHTQGRC